MKSKTAKEFVIQSSDMAIELKKISMMLDKFMKDNENKLSPKAVNLGKSIVKKFNRFA